MGLGKTIQALGVACYFKENWPLIIVCPSSMRFPWKESIINFLPNINPNITVLTSGKEQTLNGDVIISSYDLMKNCCDQIMKTKFGVIIFVSLATFGLNLDFSGKVILKDLSCIIIQMLVK